MSKVTRIAYSKDLNADKLDALSELANRLGQLRTEIWDRYGSINGVGVHHRTIRDQWVAENRELGLPARLWKETLRDTMDDIDMARESAKVKVRQAIRRHTQDEDEQQQLYRLLRSNGWPQNPYLRRMMRKYWKRGHTSVRNQIVLDKQCHKTFIKDGCTWIAISSLEKRKRIPVPLNTNVEPTGTIRVLIRDNRIEIHYSVSEKVYAKGCGEDVIGVDKGYTEAFVDSDGLYYGNGLGELLSAESDYLKAKYQNRNKLKAIAAAKPHKAERILVNNLGRKKLNNRKQKHTERVRTLVYQATHELADKAKIIVCEDLTSPISGRRYSKNQNRRLSGWVKGLLAEALDSLSHRRSSVVELVNASYTSQMDSRNGLLIGSRRGDKFYCFDGVVLDADGNAARNVLARLFDSEIDRWTPYRKVRTILLERTERQRRVLDSSGLQPEGFGSAGGERNINVVGVSADSR